MNSRQIERCRIEIAAIEAEILAGNPDLQGLCLALSDWSGETGHPPKRGTPPGGNPAARRWCDREDSALERVGALTGLALGGFDGQLHFFAQGAADEAADAMACHPVVVMMPLSVAPPGRFSSSRIWAVLLPWR